MPSLVKKHYWSEAVTFELRAVSESGSTFCGFGVDAQGRPVQKMYENHRHLFRESTIVISSAVDVLPVDAPSLSE